MSRYDGGDGLDGSATGARVVSESGYTLVTAQMM